MSTLPLYVVGVLPGLGCAGLQANVLRPRAGQVRHVGTKRGVREWVGSLVMACQIDILPSRLPKSNLANFFWGLARLLLDCKLRGFNHLRFLARVTLPTFRERVRRREFFLSLVTTPPPPRHNRVRVEQKEAVRLGTSPCAGYAHVL